MLTYELVFNNKKMTARKSPSKIDLKTNIWYFVSYEYHTSHHKKVALDYTRRNIVHGRNIHHIGINDILRSKQYEQLDKLLNS